MLFPNSRQIAGAVAGLALLAMPASAIAAEMSGPILTAAVAADQPSLTTLTAPDGDIVAADPEAIECMAKVVMHEAGHEPHDGKVAVAQTLVNRLDAKRFGDTICAVANQPGQFFNTAAYDPDRDGQSWADAVEVARAVLRGDANDVAPGAIFFRSAAHSPSGFFRSRQRVAAIGQQVFYR